MKSVFWAGWEKTDKAEGFSAVKDWESHLARVSSASRPTEMFNPVLKRAEQQILT